MKFFEDILKNRLKDAVSREGVDTDDLWADIAGALPLEEPKRKYRRLWLLFPLLMISGGALWFGLSENQAEIISSNDANITVVKKEKTTIKQTNVNEKQVIGIDINTAESTEKKATIETNISQSKKLIDSTKNEKIEKTKETIIAQNQQVTSSLKTVINKESEVAATLKKQTHTSAKHLILNELPNTDLRAPVQAEVQIQENKIISPPFKITSPLANKTFFINQNEQGKDLSDLALPINLLKKPSQKKKKLYIEIGAYSGINTVKNLFENTTKGELLQNAYKARLGYTVGTEIQLILKNNLSFSTGLEYSKTMTQFNIVQEKDGFTDNPNTTIVDENEVRAKIVRTVKHHNRLDFLTVPVIVSMSKTYGKFHLGIGAGLGLNMMLKQGGVSLNAQDEIADYYPTITSIPIPYRYRGFLSYHLRPSVNFKASENLSFQLRPEFRYSSHKPSKEEYLDFFGLKHSTFMSGLSLGLNFKL